MDIIELKEWVEVMMKFKKNDLIFEGEFFCGVFQNIEAFRVGDVLRQETKEVEVNSFHFLINQVQRYL